MLAAIKMEVMTPSIELPDEGKLSKLSSHHICFISFLLFCCGRSLVAIDYVEVFTSFLLQLLSFTCLLSVPPSLGLVDQLRQHQLYQSSYLTPSQGMQMADNNNPVLKANIGIIYLSANHLSIIF